MNKIIIMAINYPYTIVLVQVTHGLVASDCVQLAKK